MGRAGGEDIMKVATFNTNSIRTRLPIILGWLEREEPDALCVQETKVQDKDFPWSDFEDGGYQVVFRGQKAYNGVAIITKHLARDLSVDLHDGGDEDARFITAKIDDIPIVNVYVPQGYAVGTDKFIYKLQWLRDLLERVKTDHDPGKPLLLAGDFNVALEPLDVYDPEAFRGGVCFHPDEQAILREFLDWGLVDLFRKHQPDGGHYTFWDYRIPNGFKRNMGWRIDYILGTAPLAKKCRRVWIDKEPRGAQKPSDHTFLVAEFSL
jgi:exodeoxyribonuclease-3